MLRSVLRVINFIAGLLTGVAIGYALTLLLVPRSGEETRFLIRQRLRSILEEGQRAADTRRRELQERLESLRSGKRE
jgi:gas vesicle protein